ncbi:flippase activity-associated protein Agl23 [Halorientalis marina]|uniref:flippase activity-associated protein Agl23 n=1 Tax=Halorientalis marina TaxID=2931976 RepID=UPI001FF510BB|nr:flippase activity-associated protein Agl23 [Halorientalis marina]
MAVSDRPSAFARIGSTRLVIAVALAALLVRLLALGVRAVHWDEARVGYWILRTSATGDWAYRPIIHGPFVQHTTRLVIETVGPNPYTMRTVVALVGGLLPLAALLYRTRLADDELVALAVALAANPLLVHFSRFMRSDVVLAAFAFVALGCGLRALDTGRVRWVYAGALAFALAATAKENVVLYPLSWAGALTLVAAWWYRTMPADDRASTLRERLRALGRGLWGWRGHLLASLALAVVVLVGFYAPRSGTAGGVGLWNAVGDPALLPAVVREATVGSAAKVADVWLAGEMRAHPYLLYLGYYAAVLAAGAGPLVVLAAAGLVSGRGRALVAFCGWWGLSSAAGYPFVADIFAPWLAVHVVVALAVPAAVGLAAVGRRFRRARADRERAVAVALATLLLLAGLQVAVVTAETSYRAGPHEFNLLAQGAQPGSDLNAAMAEAVAATGGTSGPDVLYVGRLAVADERENDAPPAAAAWYDRLPLPWYTEAARLDVASAPDPRTVGPDAPPVVVAGPNHERVLRDRLPDHRVHEESLLLRAENRTLSVLGFEREFEGRTVLVFVRNRTG